VIRSQQVDYNSKLIKEYKLARVNLSSSFGELINLNVEDKRGMKRNSPRRTLLKLLKLLGQKMRDARILQERVSPLKQTCTCCYTFLQNILDPNL
jgi:hypothetical protein